MVQFSGVSIPYLGDDISFAGGDGGREFYLHSLIDGSVIFAPFDNTRVTIDGATHHDLDKDEYLYLEGCCAFRHIVASKPILIQTLGRDSYWNDLGTYLGGVTDTGGDALQWLSADPQYITGTVPAYSSIRVEIQIDATGVMGGVHQENICVDSNDPVNQTRCMAISLALPLEISYLPVIRR